MLAWHFIADDRRLPALGGVGRLSPHAGRLVTPGLTLRVEGHPVPERWGLHASECPADALFFARGLTVCRVRLGGEVVRGDRKVAAQEREVLWMADATQAVWRWGVACAWSWVVRARAAGRAVHPASVAAIEARELWLRDRARGEAARAEALTQARHVARKQGDRLSALCMHIVTSNSTSYRNVAQRAPGYDRTPQGRAEGLLLERLLLALEPAGGGHAEAFTGRHGGTARAGANL